MKIGDRPMAAPKVSEWPQVIDREADSLYRELDMLHGQILRAKWRLTAQPDSDALAELVDSIPMFASRVYAEWQAYEARG